MRQYFVINSVAGCLLLLASLGGCAQPLNREFSPPPEGNYTRFTYPDGSTKPSFEKLQAIRLGGGQ